MTDTLTRRSATDPSAAPETPPVPTRGRRAAALPRLELPASYVPGIDGFRAIAILSVVVNHTGLFHNGLLGVDVFFTVSGFLITGVLLREHHRTASIDLRAFYRRRLRRLVPALLVVLGLTAAAVIHWGTSREVETFGPRGLASLVFAANWQQIEAGASYWNGLDAIDPLGHMWSLAITEQFYLVWPLLVLVLVRPGRRARVGHVWQHRTFRLWLVAVVAVALGVVAALQPLVTFTGENADRVYLGSDTHAMGLVIGSLGATVRHLVLVRRARRPRRSAGRLGALVGRALVTVVSCASFAGLVVLSLMADDYTSAWLYHWGFTAAAGLATIFMLTLTAGGNPIARVLSVSPLVELGKVSYALFLVHLPIFWLITTVDPGATPLDVVILGIPASLLAAGALHHLVAEPIRLRPWRRRGATAFVTGLAGVAAVTLTAGTLHTNLNAGTGELHVLTLGDSLAVDFATALGTNVGDTVRVTDAGIPGCGISGATAHRTVPGIEQGSPAGCRPWQQRWSDAIDEAAPDVIVVNLAWDAVTSRTGQGGWTDLTDPATAAAYADRLAEMAELTTSTDAPVLVADAREFTSINTPEQASAFNDLLATAAAEHPGLSIMPLSDEVCDDEACGTTVADGSPRYIDDRVHFSRAGMRELAPWLLDQIEDAIGGARGGKTR